ncbi:MAG: S8/S53 family peptidase [Austwickia sp.]|jgi:membrane-anchored mycosin MYCP|nr:S8/S53 family peptidase [Austwickia sp.]MBK8436250.1 S8/S53 family peptidase [Austwickia sp.]MBK9101927.1 S8/S53 family peptidase [Austwickia sp.]
MDDEAVSPSTPQPPSPARPAPSYAAVPSEAFAAVPDCILVGLDDVARVVGYLRSWSAHPDEEERDTDLGLAKVTLDARAAAAHIRALPSTAGPWPAAAVRRAQERPTAGDLDLVLCALRMYADHLGEPAPTLGKNRSVDLVRVTQGIQFGGNGDVDVVRDFFGAEPAWPFAPYPRPVAVGLVDAPLIDHPYTTPSLVDGSVSPARPGPTQGHQYHGTFVAGLILRRAPHVQLRVQPIPALADGAQSWDVARAMVALSARKVPVINLSLCCLTEDDEPPLVFEQALKAIGDRSVVVAAAGNHAKDTNQNPYACRPAWPAALPAVVAVGSIDQYGKLADYSPAMDWVDVFAVGDGVVSSLFVEGRDGRSWPRYGRASGTSFAAADVTGEIANLILGGKTPAEARELVLGAEPRLRLAAATARAVPTLLPRTRWPQ